MSGVIGAVLDVLLGPDPSRGESGKPRWRWLPLRLIGPGSVPFALALTAISDAFMSDHYTNNRYSLIFAIAQCGPVVLAAYRPLLAWAVAFAAFWVFTGSTFPIDPPQPWPWVPTAMFAYFVVMFAVARRYGPAVAALAWAIPLLAGILLSLNKSIDESSPNLQLASSLSAVVVVIGSAVRLRTRARERLAEEERLTAEERARRRLLEERTRIARELHDVVAHHMSVIAVQASTAEYRLDGLSDQAKTEFETISRTARDSLTEMRRLLTVLRSADDRADREPQPGLDGLETLAATTRRAGTPVEVRTDGVPADLPEAVSLTAYRIVQEALSNVVRHASGAPTRVRVTGQPDALVVEVVNEPPPGGPTEPESKGTGLGLAGMRERVTLLDGELTAHPTDEGGFAVTVRLPYVEESST